MTSKVLITVALFGVIMGLSVAQDHGHNHDHHIDYYTYPKYEFEYKVEDHHTGDIKSQHEHRDGHNSESGYTWHDPHGFVKVSKHVSHH